MTKNSIYVATGGHSEFINWWYSKPCQPLWFKMHSCPYIVRDLPSGHCCHINACFWTFSSLKVCRCSLEIPRSPGSGLTLTEWTRVSGKEDQDWNQWDSYTHLSAALQIQNELECTWAWVKIHKHLSYFNVDFNFIHVCWAQQNSLVGQLVLPELLALGFAIWSAAL